MPPKPLMRDKTCFAISKGAIGGGDNIHKAIFPRISPGERKEKKRRGNVHGHASLCLSWRIPFAHQPHCTREKSGFWLFKVSVGSTEGHVHIEVPLTKNSDEES